MARVALVAGHRHVHIAMVMVIHDCSRIRVVLDASALPSLAVSVRKGMNVLSSGLTGSVLATRGFRVRMRAAW